MSAKQICIGVSYMESDTTGYSKNRYDGIANDMKNMLIKVGCKKDFIKKTPPSCPFPAWTTSSAPRSSTRARSMKC